MSTLRAHYETRGKQSGATFVAKSMRFAGAGKIYSCPAYELGFIKATSLQLYVRPTFYGGSTMSCVTFRTEELADATKDTPEIMAAGMCIPSLHVHCNWFDRVWAFTIRHNYPPTRHVVALRALIHVSDMHDYMHLPTELVPMAMWTAQQTNADIVSVDPRMHHGERRAIHRHNPNLLIVIACQPVDQLLLALVVGTELTVTGNVPWTQYHTKMVSRVCEQVDAPCIDKMRVATVVSDSNREDAYEATFSISDRKWHPITEFVYLLWLFRTTEQEGNVTATWFDAVIAQMLSASCQFDPSVPTESNAEQFPAIQQGRTCQPKSYMGHFAPRHTAVPETSIVMHV